MAIVSRGFPTMVALPKVATTRRSARHVPSTFQPAHAKRQSFRPGPASSANISFAIGRRGLHKADRLSAALNVSSMNTTSSATEDLLAVLVYVEVKKGTEEAFKAATIENASNSVIEPGVARFDFIQEQDDPTKFVLVEIYKTPEAPAAHKETAHYKAWAETVVDMMAKPRSNTKYRTKFPGPAASWDCSIPAADVPGKDLLAVHVFINVKVGCEEAFKAASTMNATNSIQEEGISRFDLLQEKDDPNKFVLVEVYCTDSGAAEHKDTAHYTAWRDTVANMMAEPRSNTKYINIFPACVEGWQTQLS